MKDPIVQALTEVAEALVRRGIVATPVDEGLLLRLAPVEGQAPVDGTSPDVAVAKPADGKLRNSW